MSRMFGARVLTSVYRFGGKRGRGAAAGRRVLVNDLHVLIMFVSLAGATAAAAAARVHRGERGAPLPRLADLRQEWTRHRGQGSRKHTWMWTCRIGQVFKVKSSRIVLKGALCVLSYPLVQVVLAVVQNLRRRLPRELHMNLRVKLPTVSQFQLRT